MLAELIGWAIRRSNPICLVQAIYSSDHQPKPSDINPWGIWGWLIVYHLIQPQLYSVPNPETSGIVL
jgi:hypothetical protein